VLRVGQGRGGLADHEVRSYTGWYRHMKLCLVAHVYLAAARSLANAEEQAPPPKGLGPPHLKKPEGRVSKAPGPALLVRISVQEIRRLLLALVWRMHATVDFMLWWSRWRRRHQAIAKLCHYRRSNPRLKVQL